MAILLTGLPAGIVPGFQNYTGKTLRRHAAPERRDPAAPSSPNPLGILGGDLAGFPNGRRVFDDVVTIELRAIAGSPTRCRPDVSRPTARPALLTEGTSPAPGRYLARSPTSGTPHDGYDTPAV